MNKRELLSDAKLKVNDSAHLLKNIRGDGKKDVSKRFLRDSENKLLVSCFHYSKKLINKHNWLLPFFIIIIVNFLYLLRDDNSPNNMFYKFIFISYQKDQTDMHGKGINDLYFILYHIIFFTFMRDFLMDVIIKPMALKLVDTTHKQKRVMEQMFSLIYYGISGPIGLYIMYNSNLWLFKTNTMYATYPDFTMPKSIKIFYLFQSSFWAQQASVLILQLEKPRKDYNQLVFHHIITLLLIWLSYVFHFTNMGLAVYITMDVSDWFLSLTKILNYLNSPYTPHSFIFFMLIWGYLRHFINLKILWSLMTEFKSVGDYNLNFATSQYKCWISQTITFLLIGGLQLVNLFWSFLILRILYRLVVNGVQQDERSDVESDVESIGSKDVIQTH